MENIYRKATELYEVMKNDRTYFSKNAEIGFNLYKTKEYVKKKLEEIGLQAQNCGKCGILAEINTGKEKTILLRADMDALASSDGKAAHLCGHDMHTAMLLGAARILQELKTKLSCNVKLLFQPAEETLEGAKDCIQDGVLEEPNVTAAVMLHAITAVPFPSNTVIISSPGISAPGASFFKISVSGKECHGSAPQNGIDALMCGCEIVNGLNILISRELIGTDAVITAGKFTAGEVANAIAGSAVIEGSFRAYDTDVLQKIEDKINRLSKGISSALGASSKLEITSSTPPLLNDKELFMMSKKALSYLPNLQIYTSDELHNKETDRRNSGSEDFAYISQRVPSLMIAIAAGDINRGYSYPLHHPFVAFDEEALVTGASVYAAIALAYK